MIRNRIYWNKFPVFPLLIQLIFSFDFSINEITECNSSVFEDLNSKTQISESDFNHWKDENRENLNFYHHGNSPKGQYSQEDARQGALVNLIQQVATRIISETQSENVEVINQSGENIYLSSEKHQRNRIKTWSPINQISNVKYFIVEFKNGVIQAHSYKCKIELDNDILEFDNNRFSMYERSKALLEESLQRVRYGNTAELKNSFEHLCKCYLYVTTYIERNKINDLDKLDYYFNELSKIHMQIDNKSIQVIPYLDADYNITVNSDWESDPLSFFDFEAKFKNGLNNWKENKKVFTTDSNGQMNIDFGIIYSKTEKQIVEIYPNINSAISALTLNDVIITPEAKQNLSDKVKKAVKPIEIELIIADRLPVRLNIDFDDNIRFDLNHSDHTNKIRTSFIEELDKNNNFDFISCEIGSCDFNVSIKISKIEQDISLMKYRLYGKVDIQIGDKQTTKNINFFYHTASGNVSSNNISKYLANIYNSLFKAKLMYSLNSDEKIKIQYNNQSVILDKYSTEYEIDKGLISYEYFYNDTILEKNSFYLNNNIDLKDIYTPFKVKNINYNFNIEADGNRPVNLIGMKAYMGKQAKLYSSESLEMSNYKFTFSQLNDLSHTIKVYQDGYFPYKAITPAYVSTYYDKIQLSPYNKNTLHYFAPGLFQSNYYHFQTSPLKKIQGYLMILLSSFLVYQVYDGYNNYSAILSEYDNYYAQYENIAIGTSQSVYDDTYGNLNDSYNNLNLSREELYINSILLAGIYTFNLLEITYTWGD